MISLFNYVFLLKYIINYYTSLYKNLVFLIFKFQISNLCIDDAVQVDFEIITSKGVSLNEKGVDHSYNI